MCTRRASASADLLHEYDGPTAFAIPGNHDWIDGLETYTRHIQHKGWLGGWLLPQVCLTQQSKTKRNEKKRNETKRNETKRNETKRNRRREEKRKDYNPQCKFHEKPSVRPGCPGVSVKLLPTQAFGQTQCKCCFHVLLCCMLLCVVIVSCSV